MDNLPAHRSQYPALAHKTYLNYGGQGVLSQAVLAQISENFAHIEALGSFSRAANDWELQEIDLLKQAIAEELQVSVTSITLTENTTDGCNLALWSLDWQPGDRILISDCEHPSIWAIAHCLKSRFAIEIDTFPLLSTLNDDDALLTVIADHLQPRTRMINLSHLCWNTGQVVPLSEIVQICHSHNVLVAIDAAQSVGVLPLNLTETAVDFYAFTGHKWWCGPVGVGGLYIRPEILAAIIPTFSGWRGVLKANHTDIIWRQDGQKLEVASSAYPLYGALKTAIAAANNWGNQTQRYERICKLSAYLWQSLRELPQITCIKNSPPASGLVAFKIAGQSPAQVANDLETHHQILIRAIPNPDCLRVSLHYLTTKLEIDKLISVLQTY